MLNHRIIYSDNGVLEDLSIKLNNFKSGTQAFTWTANEDFLYISSILPFNHQYFHVTSPNNVIAELYIEHWNGKAWVNTIDRLDGTKVNLRSFANSGHVSFMVDKKYNWVRSDTDRMTNSGLQTLEIYDHYWIRVMLSGDAVFTLKYIGQKFSDDEDLGTLYPDLNRAEARLQFNNGVAGKTSWEEQHIQAADLIVKDLENMYLMKDRSQIIRWHRLNHAAIHKVAEIIFNSHGNDGRENRDDAMRYYNEAIKFTATQLDLNRNTRLDDNETEPDLNLRIVRR